MLYATNNSTLTSHFQETDVLVRCDPVFCCRVAYSLSGHTKNIFTEVLESFFFQSK